jgi:hypothetical protein
MQTKTLAAALAILPTMCSSLGAQVLASNLDFYTLMPCRVVDTRDGVPLFSGTLRGFQIAGTCGVPPAAKAVALNVTVVGPTADGFVKLWPADLPEPATSAINFGPAMTRANNAMTALSVDGSGEIFVKAFLADGGPVHLILDVTGYMAPTATQCLCPTPGIPFMQVFDISPSSANVGDHVAISGENFPPNAQVLFGDATTGSSAPVFSSSSTFILAEVPSPPAGFTFFTEPCDGNGDGIPNGTRPYPTPINVNVRSLDGTGCPATFSNGFALNPPDTSCTGDNSTQQLSKKVDNDSGGFSHPSRINPAGAEVTQCQCPAADIPLPHMFGISPSIGNVGASATISGQNFASYVQVLFGDAMTGSSATIQASSSTSIALRVPVSPHGFAFTTEPCDGNGDGIPGGTRLIPTPISVNVRNLDGTGCVTTLDNAFTLNPPDTTCTGDNSTP